MALRLAAAVLLRVAPLAERKIYRAVALEKLRGSPLDSQGAFILKAGGASCHSSEEVVKCLMVSL